MTGGLTSIDYGVMAVYLLLLVGVGGVMGVYVRNVKDYFAGGHAVPWFLGALSNYMAMTSTFAFVAHAGVVYADGLIGLLLLWSPVPATLFATFFLSRRWQRAGLVTPVEYLEQRYGSSVRQIVSWGGVAFRLLDNMVRLYALGVVMCGALGCTLETAVAVCGGIAVVYTIMGGLWSVVVTDAVQCVVLLLITWVMVPLTLHAVGGLEGLTASAPEHFHWLNGANGSVWFVLVYYLIILIKYNGNWAFVQRFYSVRDERAARKMGFLSAALFAGCPLIFMFPAFAAVALVPDLPNPEEAYVRVCKLLLPPGAMGLMLAAMLSATMTTLSAEYNVTAGVLTHDIYRRLLRPAAGEREQMIVARLATVVLGALIVVGTSQVDRLGGAFEANKTLTGLIGVPLAVPLVVGVLWRRPKPWGAVASIALGIAAGVLFRKGAAWDWETATFGQILICLGTLGVSAIGESRNAAYAERVTLFFQRLAAPLEKGGDIVSGAARDCRPMVRLLAVAWGLGGALFVVVGLMNIALRSGRYLLTAGLCCCALTVGVVWRSKRQM